MSPNDNRIFSQLIDKLTINKEKIKKTLLQIKIILDEESKESSDMLNTYQKYKNLCVFYSCDVVPQLS